MLSTILPIRQTSSPKSFVRKTSQNSANKTDFSKSHFYILFCVDRTFRVYLGGKIKTRKTLKVIWTNYDSAIVVNSSNSGTTYLKTEKYQINLRLKQRFRYSCVVFVGMSNKNYTSGVIQEESCKAKAKYACIRRYKENAGK